MTPMSLGLKLEKIALPVIKEITLLLIEFVFYWPLFELKIPNSLYGLIRCNVKSIVFADIAFNETFYASRVSGPMNGDV